MITKPISDLHHYTLSYSKSISLMKTVINSKINLWISLWITYYFSGVLKTIPKPHSHLGVFPLIIQTSLVFMNSRLYGFFEDISRKRLNCILIGCILSTRDYEASFVCPEFYSNCAMSLKRFGGCCSSPPGCHRTSFSL